MTTLRPPPANTPSHPAPFPKAVLAAKGCLLPLLLLMLCVTTHAQLTYTTDNGAISITGYAGFVQNLTIPDTIDGLAVKAIGVQAFQNREDLESVNIPNSVTTIGYSAFAGCAGLTSVALPDSVTTIGNSAFSECTALTAFSVEEGNAFYSALEGVLFNRTRTSLLQYPRAKVGAPYTIPDSVTIIGDSAFTGCAGLTSVTLPDSVTTIGYSAFASCAGLTSVALPNSVTTIGDYAFYGCAGLTSVALPNSVTTIGDSTFTGCTGLTSVAFPNSVTTIRAFAFSYCFGLTRVTLPNSVTSIGASAFAHCTGLTSVTLPNSVAFIGDFAFSYCAGLTSMTIGDNVATLGASAFHGSSSLKGAYFRGRPPGVFSTQAFGDALATVYYLPGTTLWGSTFAGRPTMLWNPSAATGGADFGVKAGAFGFNITGTQNIEVVVEACESLGLPVWLPLGTNTLTTGLSYFADPDWSNHPTRVYRFRSP